MNNKQQFFAAFLLCSIFTGHGQTTLSQGDIAIIGIDTMSEDFMFVTFVPLSAGTQIYFTDEEAGGTYTIGAGEGTVLYTAPIGGIVAGTVISYKTNVSNFSITSDGDIELADSGDGIIVYQGPSVGNVTTFLHAFGESLLEIGTFPDGFFNYVLIGNDDGEYFNLRSGGTAASYLAAINNTNNWSTSGSGSLPFNLTPFIFGQQPLNDCLTLFISEYVEGSSYNKYIEIYNPTNKAITLTGNYAIQVYSNGKNSTTPINLVGTIEAYGVFVISHPNAALAIIVNQTSYSLDFSGNDAVALANSESIFDLVGVIGSNSNFAIDIGLKRKSIVKSPKLNYDPSEWDVMNNTNDVSNLGDHLGDCGLVCPFLEATTWNGSNWSNGNPNKNTTAFVNGDYNTATNGIFEACTLVINSGFVLTISNSTFVEIENNVFVKGSIILETQGSFVQNNDDGIFKIKLGGIAQVHKTTAPINAWYEYTYWSSPAANETIGVALAKAPASRRFWYNAQNYLDATAETGNNNATISGQDDIDDNGNDWQYAAANDIMIPGVGYAATQSSALFTGLGSQYNYTFTGKFNNGIINVPVYRNDSELLDTNWNFIGNPYPSAISVDAFFNENVYSLNGNGVLDGAIYLWSQDTPPSGAANGNEQLNFAQSDYVIINGIGATAAQNPGGDGVIPNRFIPSGQGFFTSFSNTASASSVSGAIKKGNVIFNNAMRVKGENNQFFKTAKETKTNILANKIWIDLTSNNGIFNQILIGYVEGATNGFDTSFYDATRNLSSGASSIIYSLIDGNNQKLAIQGKSPLNLNLEEEIKIGFYTSIKNATTFTLDISKVEGDFFSENMVYLKDDLLGIIHNLSESSYSFTSEIGEFNSRFKIVFNNKTLGTDHYFLTEKELTIREINNELVEVSVSVDCVIQKVEIIDVLGRIIYTYKGASSSVIYEVSKLSNSIYFVKVTLQNGEVVIKKAIKRL